MRVPISLFQGSQVLALKILDQGEAFGLLVREVANLRAQGRERADRGIANPGGLKAPRPGYEFEGLQAITEDPASDHWFDLALVSQTTGEFLQRAPCKVHPRLEGVRPEFGKRDIGEDAGAGAHDRSEGRTNPGIAGTVSVNLLHLGTDLRQGSTLDTISRAFHG